MKRIMVLVLSIAFMSANLVGCQSEGKARVDADNASFEQHSIVAVASKIDIEHQQEISGTNNLKGEIAYISITSLNDNSETVFDDDSLIATLKSIITSAERIKGIVNMANPEYKMIVVYENEAKQNYNLWIGEKGEKSALMNTSDTNTIYLISDEMNNKLLELLKKQ